MDGSGKQLYLLVGLNLLRLGHLCVFLSREMASGTENIPNSTAVSRKPPDR